MRQNRISPSKKKKALGAVAVKAIVLNHLRRQGTISKKSVVVSELSVRHPSLRADIAILDDEFIGIEVKSGTDSLRRLPDQIRSYFDIFDRVIVVVASKHLRNFDLSLVAGAELWEIDADGTIRVLLSAGRTKATLSLISLMTQAEIKRYGARHDLFHTRYEELDPTARRASEREQFSVAFKHRFGATSEQFWLSIGKRSIRPDDLLLLSRFHPRRERQRRWQERQTSFWSDWTSKAESIFGVQSN